MARRWADRSAYRLVYLSGDSVGSPAALIYFVGFPPISSLVTGSDVLSVASDRYNIGDFSVREVLWVLYSDVFLRCPKQVQP
jgi:hypothetical protein